MKWINRIHRYQLNRKRRKNLTNRTFSLICNNCIGAFMCHDLGLQFRSPFVNLWIKPQDYRKLLCDLEGYLNAELVFIKEDAVEYPVGLLKDIRIYFQHYSTEEEALRKWKQRCSRIDFRNLYVLFVETDGATYDDLVAFDSLPFRNKAALTHKEYPDILSAAQIPGYEQTGYVGPCYHYVSRFSGVREYDAFDYVSWFNSGTVPIRKK